MGRSVISYLQGLNSTVRGASTFRVQTWGLSPYGALAAELNFCNEGRIDCDSLSQRPQGVNRARSRCRGAEYPHRSGFLTSTPLARAGQPFQGWLSEGASDAINWRSRASSSAVNGGPAASSAPP